MRGVQISTSFRRYERCRLSCCCCCCCYFSIHFQWIFRRQVWCLNNSCLLFIHVAPSLSLCAADVVVAVVVVVAVAHRINYQLYVLLLYVRVPGVWRTTNACGHAIYFQSQPELVAQLWIFVCVFFRWNFSLLLSIFSAKSVWICACFGISRHLSSSSLRVSLTGKYPCLDGCMQLHLAKLFSIWGDDDNNNSNSNSSSSNGDIGSVQRGSRSRALAPRDIVDSVVNTFTSRAVWF